MSQADRGGCRRSDDPGQGASQGQETFLRSFPTHVQIGADNRCNLRCPACLAAAYREQGRLHIQDRHLARNPIELFQRLVPYMSYWDFVSLTGPGESLLNPKLNEILELIRRHSDCVLLITTSGVLINERIAAGFLANRVDEVALSVDSLDEKTFRELRVNGRLEQVLRAIDLLNAEKTLRKADRPRISLTPNFSRKNIEELPDFIGFARRHDIFKVQAVPTQIFRPSWVQESLLNFPDLTRRMAERARRKAGELGVDFVNKLSGVYQATDSLGPENGDSTDPTTCLKPWNNVYVEPDGDVRPCCYHDIVYGNLYETDFLSIWNGAVARRFRENMLSKSPPTSCQKCPEFKRHDPSAMIQLEAVSWEGQATGRPSGPGSGSLPPGNQKRLSAISYP